ncbi:hypothetical protein KEM60_02423 [Austwickia sp. TVS 96-490-7B]|uniref:hypothetical protein n=1 Tax=Austwickia sp. TVS 96-490-7B TaxID=2830843 RepID=UPI001C55BB39|nr:hypothetical protein [Austwickia sp. TVS 96-490-7B]MBW3086212.1 hypothetical protein [Austwickia sp. TVS 96-490-7B]
MPRTCPWCLRTAAATTIFCEGCGRPLPGGRAPIPGRASFAPLMATGPADDASTASTPSPATTPEPPQTPAEAAPPARTLMQNWHRILLPVVLVGYLGTIFLAQPEPPSTVPDPPQVMHLAADRSAPITTNECQTLDVALHSTEGSPATKRSLDGAACRINRQTNPSPKAPWTSVVIAPVVDIDTRSAARTRAVPTTEQSWPLDGFGTALLLTVTDPQGIHLEIKITPTSGDRTITVALPPQVGTSWTKVSATRRADLLTSARKVAERIHAIPQEPHPR